MSDVVPFPGAVPVPEVHTERAVYDERDRCDAESFRDMEARFAISNAWAISLEASSCNAPPAKIVFAN
jgi:hypothetical protein